MFRFYCYLFFLPMLMFSCVPAADGEDQKKLPDSEAVGPSGKVASRLETVQESVLGDMRGMNYLEAEAIDDFRNRIKQDNWGNVCALLRETDAIIRQKGKDFLELRAEKVDSMTGLQSVVMLFDLPHDLVFAGQFDEAGPKLTTWMEDSLAVLPSLLQDWRGLWAGYFEDEAGFDSD